MKQTNRTLSILLAILMLFSVATTAMAAGGNNPLTLVSAKVGDLDLEGAKISPNSEIVLTFSNNVTDSSVLTGNIGKIKVKDSTGTDTSAAVSPGSDKTVFIITIGSLAKGDYTLTIGKELAAKNGSTLGTKVEKAFKVNNGNNTDPSNPGSQNNPLAFISATVDGKDLANATVAPDAAITITFDRGMTDKQAENFAKITLWNAKNEKVAADAYQFADFKKEPKQEGVDHQNSYTVMTLKNLAAGSYTLKLGKDLEANNGNKLGEDVTISFSVKGADNDKTDVLHSIIDAIVNFFKTIAEFFKNIFKK